MDRNRRKNVKTELIAIVKGAGLFFLGKTFAGAAKLIILLLMTRTLGAALFGIYILGHTITSIMSKLSCAGLDKSVIKHISAFAGKKDAPGIKGVLISSSFFSLAAGAVLGAILYIIAPHLAASFNKPGLIYPLRIFSFGVPFITFVMVISSAAKGFKAAKYYVYSVDIFRNAFHIASIGFVIFAGWRLLGMVAAYVLSILATCFVLAFFLKKIFPDICRRKVGPRFENRALLGSSLPMMYLGVLYLIIQWTDILMLGYFVPSGEVGFYKIALALSLYVTVFQGAFLCMLSPVISEYYHKEKMGELSVIFKLVAKWVFALSLPCFLLAVIASPEILMLFGEGFSAAVLPLIILAFTQLLSALVTGTGVALVMTSHQKSNAVVCTVAVVYNVSFNYIFIAVLGWGITGAAIATAMAMLLVFALRTNLAFLHLKLIPFSRKTLKVAAAGIISGTLAIFVKMMLPGEAHYLFRLGAVFVVLGACYIFLVLRFVLEEEDSFMLKKVKSKMFFLPRTDIAAEA